MARRVLLETSYTFTPSTRTVVIPRAIPRERLLLITNVTTNQVIYNFSDSTQTATGYTIAQGGAITNATTTIVLAYNTTSMLSTNKLQITIDEPAELFAPDEAYVDPVGKLRVSQPQALIDTDFEYGLQPTKWETLSLVNGRPSFFVNTQQPITITAVQAYNGNATILVSTTTPPTAGSAFMMQDSAFSGANGPFVVDGAVVAGTSFIYTARFPYTGSSGSIYNSALTQVYTGTLYSNVSYGITGNGYSNVAVTVTTTEPHALTVGDGVYFANTTATTNPPNGSWQVTTVANSNSFGITVTSAPTGTLTNVNTNNVLPNPGGIYIHRAFDGGVQFTTGTPAHNIQTIRQTRRYFRYQSGKGIQISTGTLLKPSLNIDELSSSGTTVTVTTRLPHQLNSGVGITVANCNETAYNGTWAVEQVINANQFTYITTATPSATPASGIPYLSVNSWYGAGTRLGLFDQQNGFFFEFDGQTLYACRRKSTDQLASQVNVTNANAVVTGATINGVTTKFSKQLVPGDFIVIRGQSYRVLHIISDTILHLSTPYRGSTLSGVNTTTMSKTIDIRVPQSSWNIDTCDGTGPSGFSIDLSKMQMYYIDYSWYGAGTVRFGFRDNQGKIFYCHRFVNSNQNYEAYMRSGNLPGRYETNTFSANTTLAVSLGSGDTSMTVSSTTGFPSAGTLLIQDPSSYEYVNYTGTTATTFTGLTRGKGGSTVASITTTSGTANVTTTSSVTNIQQGQYVYGTGIPTNTYLHTIYSGATSTLKLTQAATASGTVTLNFAPMASNAAAHTYSATAPIGIFAHAPQFSPTISHWGTSVIMDGRFDDDKSLIFIYGEQLAANVAPGQNCALLSVRVSPSVDSGVPGQLGLKEIINRMQLKLQQVEVLTNGSFLVQLLLNGALTTGTNNTSGAAALSTWSRVATGTSSLAQVADHTANVQISGGENIFGFYAVNTSGTTNFSIFTQDLTQLRDLGTSILGGGYTATPSINVYPDGPDVITIVATNIGTGYGNIFSRLAWTEAQA